MSQSEFDFEDLNTELRKYDEQQDNDLGRREYLDIAQDNLHLFSKFHQDFIRSNYARFEFSSKQREIIDGMYWKHPEIYEAWVPDVMRKKPTTPT